MANEHPLMRPLRSDSLKPRPSTQASWRPQETVRTCEIPELSFAPAAKTAFWAAQESMVKASPDIQPADELEKAEPDVQPAVFAQIPEPEESEPAVPEADPLAIAFEPELPEVCAEPAEPALTFAVQDLQDAEPAESFAQAAAAEAEQPEQEARPCPEEPENSLASSIALLLANQNKEPEVQEIDFSIFADSPAHVLADEQAAPEPVQQENSLSASIATLLSGAEDDDDEDDDEHVQMHHDAVPDRFIPEPACVPLDMSVPRRKKRWWLWLIAPVVLAAGAYAAWKCGYLPINLP